MMDELIFKISILPLKTQFLFLLKHQNHYDIMKLFDTIDIDGNSLISEDEWQDFN